MTPLYFMINPAANQIMGRESDRGYIPAFFTDEENARKIFTDEKVGGIFARCDQLADFHNFLSSNENCYVLLDMECKTLREFIEILK